VGEVLRRQTQNPEAHDVWSLLLSWLRIAAQDRFRPRPATRFLTITAGAIERPAGAAISGASYRAERPMKLVSIPANPVPENVVTGMLKTPDGVGLRFARWEPPAGRRGTVCIFPGRTEWIEKYFETVRDLRARGFAVAALDWRCQGLSDRRFGDRHKGYVRSFAEYDVDLETFMREIVLPDCPPPFFALGHSMGATVLIRAVSRGHRWFDRMVLSAPMIAVAVGLPWRW
jgi:hypothetical protein